MKREKFDRSTVDKDKLDDDNDAENQSEETSTHQQRFKVTVAYDGTDFCGWQIQNKNNSGDTTSSSSSSIQGRIEQRLSSIFLGKPFGIAIAGSGRTDAGVHAKGQVFHFDAPRTIRIPDKEMKKKNSSSQTQTNEVNDDNDNRSLTSAATAATAATAENNIDNNTKKKKKSEPVIMNEVEITKEKIFQFLSTGLPPSIQVLHVEGPVPNSFHARESCVKKRYEYNVCEGQASPFETRFCFSVGAKLDLEKMKEASKYLIGKHDFSAFGVLEDGDPRSPVKNMESIEIERIITTSNIVSNFSSNNNNNSFIKITAQCDRFLWHMMRMISGTLIDVGLGKITPDDVKKLLEEKERGAKHQTAKVRVRTAPAQGLCLMKVFYHSDDDDNDE